MRTNYKRPNNSWQKVGKWYGKITEGEGHYYHKNVIIPKVLKILNINSKSKILDLGSGSGILGRSIGNEINYTGIDLSTSLIKEAERQDKSINHKYIVGDASNFDLKNKDYTDCIFILSFQNMKNAENAVKCAVSHLSTNGKLILVLNHPAFRIPRQSSWQVDSGNKTEYRRINKYMSNLEIPINMNPSDRNSELTWSYHYPISKIVEMLVGNGLLISRVEEWVSDKTSVGPASKMENVARNEFPLFMTIVGVKK
jgi:SAM-dependent methyltransferase